MYTDHNAHTKIREREDVEINTEGVERERGDVGLGSPDRKSTRLNSSHPH